MKENNNNGFLNEYLTTVARSAIVVIGFGLAYLACERTPTKKPPSFPELPSILKQVDLSDTLPTGQTDLYIAPSQVDYRTELDLRLGWALKQIEKNAFSKEEIDDLLKENEESWKAASDYHKFYVDKSNELRLELEYEQNAAARATTKRSIAQIDKLLSESGMFLSRVEVMREALREANGEKIPSDKNNESLHTVEERSNDAYICVLLNLAKDLHLKTEISGELDNLVNVRLKEKNPAEEESLGLRVTKLQTKIEQLEVAAGGNAHPLVGKFTVWLGDQKKLTCPITTKTNHQTIMAALRLYQDTAKNRQLTNGQSR